LPASGSCSSEEENEEAEEEEDEEEGGGTGVDMGYGKATGKWMSWRQGSLMQSYAHVTTTDMGLMSDDEEDIEREELVVER